MCFLFTANKKFGTLILIECAHVNASPPLFFFFQLCSGNCYCIDDDDDDDETEHLLRVFELMCTSSCFECLG